jgi:hypothetical protein
MSVSIVLTAAVVLAFSESETRQIDFRIQRGLRLVLEVPFGLESSVDR